MSFDAIFHGSINRGAPNFPALGVDITTGQLYYSGSPTSSGWQATNTQLTSAIPASPAWLDLFSVDANGTYIADFGFYPDGGTGYPVLFWENNNNFFSITFDPVNGIINPDNALKFSHIDVVGGLTGGSLSVSSTVSAGGTIAVQPVRGNAQNPLITAITASAGTVTLTVSGNNLPSGAQVTLAEFTNNPVLNGMTVTLTAGTNASALKFAYGGGIVNGAETGIAYGNQPLQITLDYGGSSGVWNLTPSGYPNPGLSGVGGGIFISNVNGRAGINFEASSGNSQLSFSLNPESRVDGKWLQLGVGSGGGISPAIVLAGSFVARGDLIPTDASGSEVVYTNLTQTTVGAAGGASGLPATPTGYLAFYKGTTKFVIPYYASV